jgi:serine/threonine protein kinase
MPVTAEQLQQLSALLDEALALDGDAARQAWLDGLGPDAQPLRPTLRRLLLNRAQQETSDFIEGGPQFTAPEDTGGAQPSATFGIGDSVGPYRLLRTLGQGGMGEVWLAERSDGQLRREVALKLPLSSPRRALLVQRFARERDILAALQHPNIARLYDAGLAADGQPYLALEFVQGDPITLHVRSRQLGGREVLALMLQVLAAVQYAHANLVIHRDIKPGNVLVTPQGHAVLLDFGIAKLLAAEDGPGGEVGETELTRLGGRALTLGYAAPEQIVGAPVSTATDVWALGVLLYELLAGVRPFHGPVRELEQAILTAEPARPPGLSADLITVLLKALKKAPAERYATVAAMADDLRRWLAGEAVLAQPDSLSYRLRKFAGRHRAAAAAAVLVLLALGGGAVLALWQASVARQEARTARAVEAFLSEVFNANSSGQANPEAARNTTARQLLAAGAKRVDQSLADAPEARERVLETLARMHDELTLHSEALVLRRQRVALLRTLRGVPVTRLAGALDDLGSSATRSGAHDEARAALDEAGRLLDRAGDTQSGRRGQLESNLAYLLMLKRDSGAREHASRAVAILRPLGPSVELVQALKRLSLVISDGDSTEPGMAAVQEALVIGEQLGDKAALQMAELRGELARLQRDRFDLVSAERTLIAAYNDALKREGPDSMVTISAAVDLGQVNHDFAEFRRALEVFDRSVVEAQRRVDGGDRSWAPVLLLGYRASSVASTGALAEGRAGLERLLAQEGTMKANPPVHTLLLEFVAEARLHQGDWPAATRALEAYERVLRNMDPINQHIEQLRLQRVQLRLAIARGDALGVRQALLPLGLDDPSKDPRRSARLVQLAEARLALGEPDAALALAGEVIAETRSSPISAWLGDRERRASIVAAQVLLAQGDAAAALPLLRSAEAHALRQFDPAWSPELALNHALLGSALLALGRRAEAAALAERAAAVLARHERLAPTPLAAVAGLQQALRTRR